jgi:hypothetical protein
MSCYMNASDILGVFEGPETSEPEPPAYNALPAFRPAEVAMVVACDQLAPRLRRDR